MEPHNIKLRHTPIPQSRVDAIRENLEQLLGYKPGEGLREGPGAVVWATLVAEGWPERIDREGGASTAVEVVREALLQVGVQVPGSGEQVVFVRQPRRDNRDPNADLRQEALSLLFAARAAKRRDVTDYRDVHLRGRLLKRGKVNSWFARQIQRDGEPTLWVPESECGKEHPDFSRASFKAVSFVWQYDARGERKERERRFFVAHGGVLDDLRLVSDALAKIYPWGPADATMFVLTGEPPTVSRITSHSVLTWPLTTRSRITMTIDPTVTPQEVMEVYKASRDHILGKRRRYRSMSEKSLRLALFTAEQPEGGTHRQQARKWNRRYPKWRYADHKVFGRAQRDVMQLLLEPFPSVLNPARGIIRVKYVKTPASQKESQRDAKKTRTE